MNNNFRAALQSITALSLRSLPGYIRHSRTLFDFQILHDIEMVILSFLGDHQLLNFPVNGRKRDAGYSFVILELQ